MFHWCKCSCTIPVECQHLVSDNKNIISSFFTLASSTDSFRTMKCIRNYNKDVTLHKLKDENVYASCRESFLGFKYST